MIKKYDVEIGKYYKYSLDNQYSSIMFNDTTGFIIKSGVVNSEENIETGTYQIMVAWHSKKINQ